MRAKLRNVTGLALVCGLAGCGSAPVVDQVKVDAAVNQVRRIAKGVQRDPSETGARQEVLDEVDPWGTKIVIFYPAQAGLFCVRAPGPDREAFTADDIQSSGGSVLVGDKIASEPKDD